MHDILSKLDKDRLIEIILKQQAEFTELKSEVNRFVERNYKGGAKSDREDYVMSVSCKDVWDLKKTIETMNKL